MKKTTLRTTSLALAAILVLGFAGISQARGHGGWDDGPRYNAPISPEQQEKAEKIFSIFLLFRRDGGIVAGTTGKGRKDFQQPL